MKRRIFVAGGAGILGGQIVPPMKGQNATSALPVFRTSNLFDTSPGTVIQDIVFREGVLYCLYTSRRDRSWAVSATTPEGSRLWQATLPGGVYLGLGTQSRSILVHALSYSDAPGHFQPNCVLRLDPSIGATLLSVLPAGESTRFYFAGESFLVRLAAAQLEVWATENSTLGLVARSRVASFSSLPHVDLLAADGIVLTGRDGITVATISIPSAVARENRIQVPEIAAAVAQYQARTNPGAGNPVVIPATTTDQNGVIHALVLPSPRGVLQAVRFSTEGAGSAWFSFQATRERQVPLKLVLAQSQIGMVYPDGVVSWYAV